MTRRKRRKFTPEFKADAVRLVRTGGKTIAEVTEQFDLTETALRAWVQAAPKPTPAKDRQGRLTTRGARGAVELRKRVKRLEMEREILKKATAFFAKESA